MSGVIERAAAPTTRQKAASEPLVRTAIGVIVSRFPRLYETSIVREISELERQGQPVLLIPLLKGHSKVVHEEAKPWLRRAIYMPLITPRIVAANLEQMVHNPRRYFRLAWELFTETLGRPDVLARTLALFPKSVYLAKLLTASGVAHLHAEFATQPATMAYIIGELSSITYSFTVHGPDVFGHRMLLREKLGRAKFVRAVSLFNKAFLAGLYPQVEDKIEVVHTGVDPDMFAPRPEEQSPREGPLRILSVAALTHTKGFTFVIDAIARLAKQGVAVELTVVGKGPAFNTIHHRADQLGVADFVHLLGEQPQEEVARLVRGCDLFVLPSVIAWSGEMDGLPVALMEAMAAAKPVIAPAISGIPELIAPRVNGFLVDITHPERIAQALQTLSDPALREQMGRAGRERVLAEFDLSRTTASLMTLIDRHEQALPTARQHVTGIRWSDLGVVALGIRHIHDRRDSVIAEVAISDGIVKREVVVKRQKDRAGQSRPAAARARDEFVVLKKMRKRLLEDVAETTGMVNYTVPHVLLFDEEHGALVMDRARGTALDVILREGRNRGDAMRLVTPMRRAGGWLRAMQQETHSDKDGREILASVVERAVRDLDLVAAADSQLRGHQEFLTEKFQSLEQRVGRHPLPVVGHHGDYWPGNIFIADRRVDVIDFEGFRDGVALEDVAYFLVHAKLFLAYPLIGRVYPRLAQSFIDGYRGGDAIDREALGLFVAANALQVMARGGGGGTLQAMWHQRVLRQTVLRSTI